MLTKWRAPAAALLAGAIVAASFAQASAEPLAAEDDASSPVVNGTASIQPQWTYREQPEVGSKQPATAEPLVDRPDTTPCTVELFKDRKFVPWDGAPPQDYDYTPPAECPGPWSKVVLEADIWADPDAALYDKTAQLFLGGVTIFYGTTMGPGVYEEDYPTYAGENPKVVPGSHEEVDLTEYSALLSQPQSGKVHIDNDATQSSYTRQPESFHEGQYMSAKLVFYPVADGDEAPRIADDVRSLDPETDEGEVIWSNDQELSYTFTDLPRNLENVYLDVHREGQRGDEFYNTTSGTHDRKIREFVVKVDGQPAGIVPAYPYKYTYGNAGGYRYYNWAPVPATSALNFIGYRVDLTPFAGVLSDGNPHTVSVNAHGIVGTGTARTCLFSLVQRYRDNAGDPFTCEKGYVLTGGSFWYVTGNLVMYRDHGAETTSGGIITNNMTATPSVTVTTAPPRAIATHDYKISGYVNTSHGTVITTVDQKFQLDTNVTNTPNLGNSVVNQITEIEATTTVNDSGNTSSTTVNLSYIDQNGTVRADGLNTFGWTYAAQTKFNGNDTGWVKISDLYTTVPNSFAAEQQYVAFDSSGKCYDRTLSADITARKPAITGVADGVACDALVKPVVQLSASPNGFQTQGGEVVLTAALDEGATGLVEFFDGDVSLGTAAVVDGAAVLKTSSLALGEHSLTARYTADLAAGGKFASSDPSDAVVFWVTPFKLTAEMGSRCVAGKAMPTVTVTNGEAATMSVTVESEFGSKVLSVAPGKNGFHAFTSRLTSLDAGTMSIVAKTGDREFSMTLDYPAMSCN